MWTFPAFKQFPNLFPGKDVLLGIWYFCSDIPFSLSQIIFKDPSEMNKGNNDPLNLGDILIT